MALPNVTHSNLFARGNPQALWERLEKMVEDEWSMFRKLSPEHLSMAKIQPLLFSEPTSNHLGIGSRWLGPKTLELATTHAALGKMGGSRDGAFVVLVPGFERLMHAWDKSSGPQLDAMPPTVMIAKIVGHPEPADAQDRERVAKSLSEFPATVANFDASSIASLHFVFLKLEVQKYATLVDAPPLVEGGAAGKRFEYHVTSWSFEPLCWMALIVDEDMLGQLINAQPAERSMCVPFGRFTSTDLSLPALPRGSKAHEPKLHFAPRHFFRSRIGVLGGTGSGKSNLIKTLLVGLKGPSSPIPKTEKVGLLLLDPQGEYAQANRQGDALVHRINGGPEPKRPDALVYSFMERKSQSNVHKALCVNFFLEPRKAQELAKTLPGADSAYLRSAFAASIPAPMEILESYVREALAAVNLSEDNDEHRLAMEALRGWLSPDTKSFHASWVKKWLMGFSKYSLSKHVDQVEKNHLISIKHPQAFARETLSVILACARRAREDHSAGMAAGAQKTLRDDWEVVLAWWLCLEMAGFNPEADLLCAGAWRFFFEDIGCHPFSTASAAPLSLAGPKPPERHADFEAEPLFKTAVVKHLRDLSSKFEVPHGVKRPPSAQMLKDAGFSSVGNRDLEHIANFLNPPGSGTGPNFMSSLRPYHDVGSVDSEGKLVDFVIAGGTAIVNLADTGQGGGAAIKREFSARICEDLFQKLQRKFAIKDGSGGQEQEALADDDFNVIVAIEEAQDVLSARDGDETIFKKIVLQGRKLGLGMLFATQSPSNIDPNLYKECNMLFCFNLKSMREISNLQEQQADLRSIADKLASWQKPGLGHWWRSDALVIPFQADEFSKNKGI